MSPLEIPKKDGGNLPLEVPAVGVVVNPATDSQLHVPANVTFDCPVEARLFLTQEQN